MPVIPAQETVLPIIQLSITPVILISGIGSLVIAMTNRWGRIVDRTRILAGQARQSSGADREHLENQLTIMFRRAKLMRFGMTMAMMSMFVSGLLIMIIFAGGVFGRSFEPLMLGVFIASVTLLLGALAAFIRDVFVSLTALNAEVERALAH